MGRQSSCQTLCISMKLMLGSDGSTRTSNLEPHLLYATVNSSSSARLLLPITSIYLPSFWTRLQTYTFISEPQESITQWLSGKGVKMPWDTTVAPGVLAVNHQHLFNIHIDLTIDGRRNTVVCKDIVAASEDPEANPFGVTFKVQE